MKRFKSKYCTSFLALLVVFGGCDREVSRTPTAPPPSTGFIYLNSTPGGFNIYQNGRNTGRLTPDSLSFLDPGDYEITFKKQYWKDTSIVIIVTEEAPVEVNIDYFSNASMYGSLVFISEPPGAQIIMNDSLLNNTTPETINNLLPGKYNIAFRLEEHRDEIFEAIVESSLRKTYNSALRDTSEWIDFQVFNSGIQSNLLTSLTIDQNGVKWIGSLNNGVISYNDVDFVNYNELTSPVPDNRINCVSVDALNRIWIGTDFGLAVLDGSSWTIYNRNNSGLTSEIINSVNFDDAGNAWIGNSAGLIKFDGFTWERFNDPQLRVWAMDSEFDDFGVNWIGTKREGIVTLENDILTFLPDSIYNYPTNKITSVSRDQMGNMWFTHLPDSGRRSGISHWDGNNFNNNFLGTNDNDIYNVHIDVINNKWVCTDEGFVWFDQQNSIQHFTTLNSLISSDQTRASVADQNGVLWIATSGSGLNKFKVNNIR
jgi:hypothetical protein